MPVRLLNRFRHATLACLLGSLSLNAAADPVTLTLYNGQHAATGIAIAKAFQDKTGIQVKIRKGGDGQLASQITEEGERSPADVLYTEESPPLIRLASAGRLARLEPETLALVEPEHAGANGDWIGITARTRVLAYNPKKIDEKGLPKSLMDLSDPSWSGRFGVVPTSGAVLEQVAAVIKLKGQEEAEDWLTGLKAFGSIYTNNVTAMKAVENGEVDMALINNYYWYTLKKEKGELNSRLHYFGNQDPGALVTVSGAAVLKSSKHPREAQQFVAFMLSEEGQKAILSQSAEYPMRKGMQADPALKPFAELDPPKLTPADLGEASEALSLERDVGLN
ncbi:iron ABC transporter substrate-binding protein [Pseudomonas aeruginosa]|nr:iron ABC transporter substrate-binding protein [Pseudomonas aeruginosa]